MINDHAYANSKNAWGDEPNLPIQMVADDLPADSIILDIGSGQGRDALYLASRGYHIVAVERSRVGHDQLIEKMAEKKIANITPVNDDILNFEIEKDKFSLISMQNVVQFLPKRKSVELIREAKEKLPKNGLIAISAFTIDDDSYKVSGQPIVSYFERQEMLKIFTDFNIIYYFEKIVFDPGHASTPTPHYHGAVRIIAKKI
jgi:tellurite methyltransferase